MKILPLKEKKWRKYPPVLLLICALILMFSSGCVTAFQDENYVPVPPEAKKAGIKFSEGKREIALNGNTVYLSYPCRDGKIHRIDLPFLKNPELNGVSRRRVSPGNGLILIDPGHGGKENGARGRNSLEKDLNLAVALELARALRKEKYQVALTRDGDKTLSLSERSAMARKMNAALFISLHHNASANSSSSGIEAYSVTPAGAGSTNSPDEIDSKTYPGNRFDLAGKRLAVLCMRELIAAGIGPDRGVRQARFAVLKNAPCPAVLLELGFVTSPAEEKLLADPSRRRRVVSAIVKAIKKY